MAQLLLVYAVTVTSDVTHFFNVARSVNDSMTNTEHYLEQVDVCTCLLCLSESNISIGAKTRPRVSNRRDSRFVGVAENQCSCEHFFFADEKHCRALRRFGQGRAIAARRSEPLTGSAQRAILNRQQEKRGFGEPDQAKVTKAAGIHEIDCAFLTFYKPIPMLILRSWCGCLEISRAESMFVSAPISGTCALCRGRSCASEAGSFSRLSVKICASSALRETET